MFLYFLWSGLPVACTSVAARCVALSRWTLGSGVTRVPLMGMMGRCRGSCAGCGCHDEVAPIITPQREALVRIKGYFRECTSPASARNSFPPLPGTTAARAPGTFGHARHNTRALANVRPTPPSKRGRPSLQRQTPIPKNLPRHSRVESTMMQRLSRFQGLAGLAAGAYTRPLSSST